MGYNPIMHGSMEDVVMNVATEMARKTEESIFEQLNDFISRGLIVVEKTNPTLTQDFMSNKVMVSQQVRLTLKDKEYIEKLEKENKEMKSLLEALKAAVPGIA